VPDRPKNFIKMKKYQAISAVFWVGFSLFVMIFSYKLGLGRFQEPGPGLMSFLASLFLLLISSLFLVSLYLKRGVQSETTREKGHTEKLELLRIAFVLALLFAYALLLEQLGYLVISTLTLILCLEA